MWLRLSRVWQRDIGIGFFFPVKQKRTRGYFYCRLSGRRVCRTYLGFDLPLLCLSIPPILAPSPPLRRPRLWLVRSAEIEGRSRYSNLIGWRRERAGSAIGQLNQRGWRYWPETLRRLPLRCRMYCQFRVKNWALLRGFQVLPYPQDLHERIHFYYNLFLPIFLFLSLILNAKFINSDCINVTSLFFNTYIYIYLHVYRYGYRYWYRHKYRYTYHIQKLTVTKVKDIFSSKSYRFHCVVQKIQCFADTLWTIVRIVLDNECHLFASRWQRRLV